jgi:hypothetical protein
MTGSGCRNVVAADVTAWTPPHSLVDQAPVPDRSHSHTPWGCGTAGQVDRLMTVAALRPLGFPVAELDHLLAILEELDDGWAASDMQGTLLGELRRFCHVADNRKRAAGRRTEQAVAALHRRHAELAATGDGFRW